jgi:hypothetical protein
MQNIRVIFKIILIAITIKNNYIKLSLTNIITTKIYVNLKIQKNSKK